MSGKGATIGATGIFTQLPDRTMAIIEDYKYTLPDLPYPYDALEPYISKDIMTLHHDKHHKAYVDNLNIAIDKLKALPDGDVKEIIELQKTINFNGGGHINHSLFWLNLTPCSTPAASPSSAPSLLAAIEKKWKCYKNFQDAFNQTLLGIQGSGWGWLVKDTTGDLEIETTKDQDPILGNVPLFGVDMWEHAYYLQYFNDKTSYVTRIWNIINWETAESRYTGQEDPRR